MPNKKPIYAVSILFSHGDFVLALPWTKFSTPPVQMLLSGPILGRDIPVPELSSHVQERTYSTCIWMYSQFDREVQI